VGFSERGPILTSSVRSVHIQRGRRSTTSPSTRAATPAGVARHDDKYRCKATMECDKIATCSAAPTRSDLPESASCVPSRLPQPADASPVSIDGTSAMVFSGAMRGGDCRTLCPNPMGLLFCLGLQIAACQVESRQRAHHRRDPSRLPRDVAPAFANGDHQFNLVVQILLGFPGGGPPGG